MQWKRRMAGGVIGIVGFLLSPLSWWNDLFVNVPLAVGFGWLISLLHAPAFEPAVIVGYWLTNVLGFVLLHKGTHAALSNAPPPPYTRKNLLKDLSVSLLYTGLIVILIHTGVLKPVTQYFQRPAPSPSSTPATNHPAEPGR